MMRSGFIMLGKVFVLVVTIGKECRFWLLMIIVFMSFVDMRDLKPFLF